MNKKIFFGLAIILCTILLAQGVAAAVEVQIDGSGSNDAQTVQAGSNVSLSIRARDTAATNPFNISVENETITMTGGTWTFSPDIATTPEVLVNATSWKTFTLNVTVPSMAAKDTEFKFKLFAQEVGNASNNDTIQETMTVGDTERITITPSKTTDNLPPSGLEIYQLTITNNGPNTENITLSSTEPTGWGVSFNDTILQNVPSLGSRNVWCRIDVASDASVSSTYTVKPTVSADTADLNETEINITIDPQINLGNSTQEAMGWLEAQITVGGDWGTAEQDAWAVWSYHSITGYNSSIFTDALSHINSTQLGNGRWNNEDDTALTVYALVSAGRTQSNTNSWDNGGIKNATDYLLTQVNTTLALPTTAKSLAAIYKADKDGGYANVNANVNVSNALVWLKDQQNTTSTSPLFGSFGGGDVEETAWALIATQEAIDNGKTGYGTSRDRARDWLKDQQNLNGSIGDGSNIEETALVMIALREAGVENDATWTVELNGSTTATEHEYDGSMWMATYFVYTQQEGGGGWGFSPANVEGTSHGLLALGGGGTGFASVHGQIIGKSGTPAENQTINASSITFSKSGSSDVTVTTNSTGHYVANLEAGTWDYEATHTNYVTKSDSVTLTAGEDEENNFTMAPKITVSISPDTADKVANSTLSYTGTAVYKFNTSIKVNKGTYKVMVGSKTFDSGTTTTAGAIDDSFRVNLAAGSYDAKVNVSKSGAWGTDTIDLTVTGGGGGDLAGGGGGGGGDSENYDLRITSYDNKLTIAQGATKTVQVIAKNYGISSLEDVSLTLSGVSSSWYTVNTTTGGHTEDLATGEIVTFNVKFVVPEDAVVKAYNGTWKVEDKYSHDSSEKDMTLTVTEVWTQTTITDLSGDLDGLEDKLANLTAQIDALEADGDNVTGLRTQLDELNQTIIDAKNAYATGQYSEAQSKINSANSQASSIESAISGLTTAARGGLPAGTASKILLIIIVLAAGGAVGVFVLWYKFMRVTPISAIKENPKMFGEGTRVEGVVKSITDTKKGKVFMVSDESGKLHVRYPYYTTLSKGDVVRAAGSVKTYKDVPYMDATDMARVTVKTKG